MYKRSNNTEDLDEKLYFGTNLTFLNFVKNACSVADGTVFAVDGLFLRFF